MCLRHFFFPFFHSPDHKVVSPFITLASNSLVLLSQTCKFILKHLLKTLDGPFNYKINLLLIQTWHRIMVKEWKGMGKCSQSHESIISVLGLCPFINAKVVDLLTRFLAQPMAFHRVILFRFFLKNLANQQS